jgi:F0F1-type ATP synthase membrane subunit b/b'
MEVNVTLLLQVIQFLCVYYALYKLLFIPAYQILDEQEQVKKTLYKELEVAQQIKDALLQDFHIKTDVFKATLLQEIPEQASQSGYQKSTIHRVVGHSQPEQILQEDIEKTETFLVDHLSRIIK